VGSRTLAAQSTISYANSRRPRTSTAHGLGVAFVPCRSDATNAPAPILTSRNMTTKTGNKEGKHGVFLDDLPRFLQKSGDFFAVSPNNR